MISNNLSLVKCVSCLCLILLPFLSLSQVVSRESIDLAIDKYCSCVSSANAKSEILACSIELDTTSAKLSELDKFYVTRKMLRQCGEAKTRFDEQKRDLKMVDGFLYMGCTLFTKNDLIKYKLKLDSSSRLFFPILSEVWLPDVKETSDCIVLRVEQFRQHISEDAKIERWKNSEQKVLATFAISDNFFDFLSIAGKEKNDSYEYSIMARKGGLICGLTVVSKNANSAMRDEFIRMLTEKVRACQL